ncbi:PRC-barrel domain-containing protein [Paenarthrobacter sp. NPDC056912]|uniref:PRC-barrel domain-containing protein n=1 Tax=Paenarthrobacter sp. NPDC056912 TaxID=3345965 RepID=UPI00366B7573
MLSLQEIDTIVLNGGIVVDSAGEKIGSVEQVFVSGDSGDPVFVTVRTGLFGMSESFAPLSGASLEETVITLAVAKDRVKNGPRIESDRGVITESQEQELFEYFGLQTDAGNEATTEPAVPAQASAGRAEPLPPPPPPHLHRHVPPRPPLPDYGDGPHLPGPPHTHQGPHHRPPGLHGPGQT